ncbi:MAG: glycosyltransferase family 4 protein [bacterium]|nr:glycosyltransferase family 4 protein [bacterium]
MTIAFLSTMSGFYGGEICIVELAAGFKARGHRVVCVARPGSLLAGRAAAVGLETVTLPLLDWYEPLGVGRLRRLLVERGVEILHTHVPRDHYIAAVATAGLSIRNVGTRHLLNPIHAVPLKRPFFRRFSALVAVSDAVRRSLEVAALVPPERLVTIPNGVPYPPPAPYEGLRRRAGVPPRAQVVGFVGRLCPTKGLGILLAAADRLRDRCPDLRILVAGEDGNDRRHGAALRREVARRGLDRTVTFLGYVPEAGRYCAEFDVQVVPSRAEPFGLVTLEALARGCPVVATAAGGSPEIVRHGREGFLVPPGDADALAVHLERLLASPELRRDMGEQGRVRVRNRFTADRMVESTLALYERVLGREPRARSGLA